MTRNSKYEIVICRDGASGEFYRVYIKGQVDGLSDHASEIVAEEAIQRYEAADRRRTAA